MATEGASNRNEYRNQLLKAGHHLKTGGSN